MDGRTRYFIVVSRTFRGLHRLSLNQSSNLNQTCHCHPFGVVTGRDSPMLASYRILGTPDDHKPKCYKRSQREVYDFHSGFSGQAILIIIDIQSPEKSL